MHRIGVISDSHGNFDNLFQAVERMGEIDVLIHAGDGVEEALALSKQLDIPVECVKGNCDFVSNVGAEKQLTYFGKKFFLTHGKSYGVKLSLNRLYYRAVELKTDVVIFGHTHVPFNKGEDGILFFNPGSISKPISGNPPTFGIIYVEEAGEVSGEIIQLG